MVRNEYRDLGWENGWVNTPKVVKECNEKGHERIIDQQIHTTTIKCDKCKYYYKVDTSG